MRWVARLIDRINMKGFVAGVALVVGGVASLSSFAFANPPLAVQLIRARQPDTIRPGIKVGPVNVGGEEPEAAAKALRIWWLGVKATRLKIIAPGLTSKSISLKPSELGVTLEPEASVRTLPMQEAGGPAGVEPPDGVYPLVFRFIPERAAEVQQRLKELVSPSHPARVRYVDGGILRVPEVATDGIDEAQLPVAVGKAILGDHTVVLPLTGPQKHVPDEALNQIKEVVTSFSTRFSTRTRTRCSNIKLAASIIDGTVLLPGERFSFNGVVGRRTLKAGFKVAGVYINGQHDTGIGGGICQVSTTLYNSVLLADLPIYRRSNHSLPVPYVPLGQDATVDYGNLDLVFENTYPTPIAISSYYRPGQLTFRVLGQKQPGLSVKIVRGRITSAPASVEHVPDPHLALGVKKVVKPGATFRSVSTFRMVYQDGKLVKKEPLGHSRYGGMPRVVLVGTAAPVRTIPSTTPGTTPGTTVDTPSVTPLPHSTPAVLPGGH